jgi:uncharacterized repeat protein (TIGR01451 family)
MPLPYRFLAKWFSGVSRNRKLSRQRHRRRLLMESLETRSLLAADLASIAGAAFIDQTDDGLTPGDAPLEGVAIHLYLDDGDGVFSNDDPLIGSTTTDSQGAYRFDGLAAGLYFVEQAAVASVLQRPDVQVQAVVITVEDAEGTSGLIIDSFDSTTQSVVVTGTGPDSRSSSMLAPEAIGGQRDLRVELDSGSGDVRIRVNHLDNALLRYDLDRNLVARGLVTWDGQDNDADQLDATGLGGIDITESGVNLGLRILSGINLPGGSMTFRVYTDATNFSSYTLGIPVVQDGDPLAASTIFFADPLWVPTGIGVDLTNVGAIQLEIDAGVSWADCDFKDLGTVRPTVKVLNFANLNPMSLGDTVWFDQNNNGFLDAGEPGIAGVELTLYEDTDGDGFFTPGVDQPLATTTTDTNGIYGFGGLFPGSYLVQIGPTNFEPGGPLHGLVASTGLQPVPDPNNDVDNDNNGYELEGFGVVSRALTLEAGSEPVSNTDQDPNANLTLDLGFTALADLQVTKSDDPDPVNAGSTLTYTLVVTNHGPSPATNVVLTDPLPVGVILVEVQTTRGTAEETAGTITANLGDMQVGESAIVTIVVTVDSSWTEGLRNTAQVTSDTLDPDPQNNLAEEPTEVEQLVNLSITKSDTPDPVVAGQPLTYTLLVRNDGPSDATGVVVVDDLPGDVTFVSWVTSQGSVSHSDGVVTANLGNLAAGQSATITLNVHVSPAARDTLTNRAHVSANEEEMDDEDNRAEVETTVIVVVDLAITKLDNPDPVVAGQQLTYTLEVSNLGASQATGVTVIDTLPPGVSFVSATTTQGTTSHAGGIVTVNLGDMAPGQMETVTILVAVAPTAHGTLTNTASVSGNEQETNTDNNEDTVSTIVQPLIDLAIAKTHSPEEVVAGEQLTYTLQVGNLGPSQATGVTVEDILPPNVSFVTATSTQGTATHAGGTVIVNMGNMAAGQTETVTIVVTVAPTARETMTNRATVTGNEPDADPDNNEDEISTPVRPLINLTITKADDPNLVMPGNELTYTLSVTNEGPSHATGVRVVDTLPPDVSFVSASTTTGTFGHSNGEVTVNLGNMATGQTETITIVVTVAPSARATLVNTAIVSGNEPETNMNDNTASVSTEIDPVVDLVIFKADSPDPVMAGQELTYTLSIVNNGPSNATGVVVTDELPAGVSFVSATSSQGTFVHTDGTVTATLGNLARGGTATVSILVFVDPSTRGTITNTASVTSTERDSQPDDNTDSEPTLVQARVNLAIAKTGSPEPVTAGELLTYTLTVTNEGPSKATGVNVQDLLPPQVTFVSATTSQGTVTHSQQIVTANLGDMAAGSSQTVTVVTRVDSHFAGTIINRATVSGTEAETTLDDNTAQWPTVVDALMSSLAGFVYVDRNNNGLKDPGEEGIAGVMIRLNGVAQDGSTIAHQQLSASDGSYRFDNLPAGVYQLTQDQPENYLDGRDTPGTAPTELVENNRFEGIRLDPGVGAVDFLFGERLPVFSKRLFLGSTQ